MRINYYEVLGIDRTATEQQIRDRFRKLARENHPDRYQGKDKSEAERKFQTLTEALNVLTNPARRKQHDSELQSTGGKPAHDPAQVAKAYLAMGVKAFKEKDYVTARENFDMSVKHHGEDPKALHYLALASAKIAGGMRQAVQAIEGAVARDPMNGQILKDAGLICKRAGLPAKAERYLEEALKWDRDNAEVLRALDELRENRGETKESGKGLLDSLFKKG